MRVTRVYVDAPLATGQRVALSELASGHLLRVLRAGIGDECILFNGDGHDYDARIVATGKRKADVEILGGRALQNESPLRITLLQALARGEKMDWILQKASELGVAAFVPVISERSEIKLSGDRADKRVAHWQGVVISACGQSGRAIVPLVSTPTALGDALGALPAGTRRWLLDPLAGSGLLSGNAQALCGEAGREPDAMVLAIGPEGGWSENDARALKEAGFNGLRLGPRVLRTETAGIAAIAALQACYGDLS